MSLTNEHIDPCNETPGCWNRTGTSGTGLSLQLNHIGRLLQAESCNETRDAWNKQTGLRLHPVVFFPLERNNLSVVDMNGMGGVCTARTTRRGRRQPPTRSHSTTSFSSPSEALAQAIYLEAPRSVSMSRTYCSRSRSCARLRSIAVPGRAF